MTEETLLALAEKGWTPEQIAAIAPMFAKPEPKAPDPDPVPDYTEPEPDPMEAINATIFG